MDSPKTMSQKYAMDTSNALSQKINCGHCKDPVTKDMLLTLQTLSQKICDMYRNSKDIVTKDMLLALLRPCNKICYAHIKHPVARYAMKSSKTPSQDMLWTLQRSSNKKYAMGTKKTLSQEICYGHSKYPVTYNMIWSLQRLCHKML